MEQQRLDADQIWQTDQGGGSGSTLTAVREEPGGCLLHSSDWLVFKRQQCPVEGGVRPQGRGVSVVLLTFGQQVTDLLLQLQTDGVLGQNQNAQTGRVVLHHVQENLHSGHQDM